MSPQQILVLVAASWTITTVLTPLAARLARRWGFIDRPAEHKFHDEAKPLLGGLAICLGALLPLLLMAPKSPRLWAFAAAAALLVAVGLRDDRRHVSVRVKLAAQSAAALILLAGGIHADLPLPAWAAALLSLLWIVGITNAMNLLDSMDGVAAGVAAIAAAGFLALAAGSPLAIALAAALLGAALAFLPYNFQPARLFMGDAGSFFLGLGLATLGLEAEFAGAGPGVAWMVPVLLLAVPIFDTTLVSWSRLRQGKNPMTHPGKDHFAHRLSRRGLGVRGAVVGLYLLGVLAAVLAFAVSRGGTAVAWGIGAGVALGSAAGVMWLDRSP